MHEGWIKLYRKTLENKTFLHDPTAWRIFEYLLLIVDKDTGTRDIGRFQLSLALDIKPSTIYKALKRLEKCQMVNIKSNNKYSTIYICNWQQYQNNSITSSNNKVTTKEQQSNTKQELRIKKEEDTNTDVLVSVPKGTLTKEQLKEYSTTLIDQIISYYEELYGHPPTNYPRRWAWNIIRNLKDIEKVKTLMKFACDIQGREYSPKVGSLKDLYYKIDDLRIHYKKLKGRSQNGYIDLETI